MSAVRMPLLLLVVATAAADDPTCATALLPDAEGASMVQVKGTAASRSSSQKKKGGPEWNDFITGIAAQDQGASNPFAGAIKVTAEHRAQMRRANRKAEVLAIVNGDDWKEKCETWASGSVPCTTALCDCYCPGSQNLNRNTCVHFNEVKLLSRDGLDGLRVVGEPRRTDFVSEEMEGRHGLLKSNHHFWPKEDEDRAEEEYEQAVADFEEASELYNRLPENQRFTIDEGRLILEYGMVQAPKLNLPTRESDKFHLWTSCEDRSGHRIAPDYCEAPYYR